METRGKLRVVAAACLLIVGLSAVASARIIYVDDAATGPNNGTSWANAFMYLEWALSAAVPGDEIRVAQGHYRPARRSPGSKRSPVVVVDPLAGPHVAFQLKSGVTILGGFAGVGAEDPNDRDVARYQTILAGDIHGNDVDSWGPGHPMYETLRKDNSAYVVESHDVDSTAVLDGFIIQSATVNGMYNRNGSPRVLNCTFRWNSSGVAGGGAVRSEGGAPSFFNCVFEANTAEVAGGAIYASDTHLTLSDCHFIDNWATGPGGAIHSVDSDLSLTGCTFIRNVGQQGGAIHHWQGTLTLTDCRFEANVADRRGGAIDLREQQSASMTRSVFRRNRASDSGGAIANGLSPLLIEGCSFGGNRAEGGGGAIATKGSSAFDPDSQMEGTIMVGCLFTGNHASAGGALLGHRARFAILNCTFANNEATVGSSLGWPIVWGDEIMCQVAMENSIVYDGTTSISGWYAMRPHPWAEPSRAEVTIRYSNVQGGWPGEGNIDADPLFARPGYWGDAGNPSRIVNPNDSRAVWIDGDYRLKSQAGRWDPVSETWVLDDVTSPCIDAGDPDSPVGDEPEPNGGRINMGAYGGTAEASKS